jgi:hypothetical protein
VLENDGISKLHSDIVATTLMRDVFTPLGFNVDPPISTMHELTNYVKSEKYRKVRPGEYSLMVV